MRDVSDRADAAAQEVRGQLTERSRVESAMAERLAALEMALSQAKESASAPAAKIEAVEAAAREAAARAELASLQGEVSRLTSLLAERRSATAPPQRGRWRSS